MVWLSSTLKVFILIVYVPALLQSDVHSMYLRHVFICRQVNAKKPKTREEAQKEILDAELDMFTKQQVSEILITNIFISYDTTPNS